MIFYLWWADGRHKTWGCSDTGSSARHILSLAVRSARLFGVRKVVVSTPVATWTHEVTP